MHAHLSTPLLLAAAMMALGCGTKANHLLTAKVYESPNQVVRLQAIPDANKGRGYTHPADLSQERVAKVLEGLRVDKNMSPIPLAFQRGVDKTATVPAFTEAEVKFFAPLLTKGLAKATPREVVTFYETADINSIQRVITSGCVFIVGDAFHVMISNHLVKDNIFKDVEYYQAPYRLRPIRPIEHYTEPGRLLFEPDRYMIEPDEMGFGELTRGLQLHIAVRFKALPASEGLRTRD